jgi:hypothetical protein
LFVVFGHLVWGTPRLPAFRDGFVFLMPVFGVFCLEASFSDSNSPVPFGVGCFCLESLILAQDERWRRA